MNAETQPVELEQESMDGCCIEKWPEHITAFLEHLQDLGRAPRTLEHYQTSLKPWLRFLATRDITTLAATTPQIVADYQTWLYQARSRYGRPYSLSTQIHLLNAVQVLFAWLHKSGRLVHNPAEVIRLPKDPKKLPRTILSPSEMKRLLHQPDTGAVLGFRDRTIYEVLYSTGLRIGELIRMRTEAWDADQSTLFVAQGKHYKDRYVPLGEIAGRYLAEYFNHVRPHLMKKADEPILFLSRCGRALDDSGLQLKLRIYAQGAHIKKHLTIHVFRHTLATEMLRRGADLRQIQELLGHKNLTTTQRYTHLVKGDLARAQHRCHPREQLELPEHFVRYRGRTWLEPDEH